MNNLYTGAYIDASYQVSFHLAKGFQRRRLKCERFTDRQTPSDGNSSGCLWQGELKKKKKEYCIKYFLPQVRIKLIKISINM
jgi:hypothetical protein